MINGPIFEPEPDKELNPKGDKDGVFNQSYKVLGKDGVAVPTHLFKIIKCNVGDNHSYASAFIFKNKPSNDNSLRLRDFEIPLEDLTIKTGLVFNLKNSQSLLDYDYGTLFTVKEEYDKEILYPKLFRSSSYDSASDELRKIRAHKIK